MKILVSAFSFSPNRGSEPGVGWNWSKLMTDLGHDVTVITTDEFKQNVVEELAQSPNPLMRVIFIDRPEKVKKKSVYHWNSYFQRESYRFLKKYVQSHSFDCAWFLTMGNAFLPTRLYKLGLPYIYGPIAAGEQVYPAIYHSWGIRDRLPHVAKNGMIHLFWFMPNVRSNAKKASAILTRTPDTTRLFPNKIQRKCVLAPETFFPKEDVDAIVQNATPKGDKDFTFFYDGRLISLKGLDIAIKAFLNALPLMPNAKFVIVGGGPKEQELKWLCKDESAVIFKGKMPRNETLKLLGQSDCFLFPSLREGCAWSLAEAMSMKKPIICIDGNGVGMLTSNDCAIRVHADKKTKSSDLVKEFEEAMKRMYCLSETERERLGGSGYQRILVSFSTESAANIITKALETLLKRG